MSEIPSPYGDADPQPDLAARYNKLFVTLGQRIGDVHERLRHADMRRTMGDQLAAQLTYGQLTHRPPGQHSPDLPSGAVPCNDQLALLILMEGHLANINGCLDGKFKPPITNLANFPMIEQPAPVVEDHTWFKACRAYLKQVANPLAPDFDAPDSVIIFVSNMTFTKVGGAPFPVMYTVGEVAPETAQAIAIAYSYPPRDILM